MQATGEAIRAARLFELYVRAIWPLHRRLVRRSIARRCRRCAASERMIPLGADDVCALCTQERPPGDALSDRATPAEGEALNEVLRSAVGQGRRGHDALVLFSGGKDSAYLIKRIQMEFPGLRLLAYTMDNGFMSPVAKENVERLIPQLGVAHLFVRPPAQFFIKMFRYTLTHLNDQGGYGTVDFSDGEFMLDTARRLAAEKEIPLILCGYSRYQVQDGLKLRSFESPRERELADRTDVAGLPLADIFSPDEIAMWWHASAWAPERVARLLFPLYAWDLEESEIKQRAGEWGLLAEREQSPIVTNHRLIPLIGVVDVHQLGYSSFEIELCRMIREGKANQREWQHVFELLEHTSRTGLFVKPAVLASLAELRLSLADVGVRFAGTPSTEGALSSRS